jgi:hypothetical protein
MTKKTAGFFGRSDDFFDFFDDLKTGVIKTRITEVLKVDALVVIGAKKVQELAFGEYEPSFGPPLRDVFLNLGTLDYKSMFSHLLIGRQLFGMHQSKSNCSWIELKNQERNDFIVDGLGIAKKDRPKYKNLA